MTILIIRMCLQEECSAWVEETPPNNERNKKDANNWEAGEEGNESVP